MKRTQDILRNMREDKDLKQSDIAEMIGTTQQQYSRYETGESELPLRALTILADYYNVSADYLIGRIDCLNDVPGVNKRVTVDKTVGEVMTDILSLTTASRAFLVEFISLLKIKEGIAKKKGKNGSRK